jgi:ribosome-binding protein aMBF1 (putative translation factor)
MPPPMATQHYTFEEVLEESLRDPETRAEWDRTQLARDVSIRLLTYRRDRELTQVALAKQLGWTQSVVARLESGEHEPSIATLRHLVERLGTTARIDIRPEGVAVHFSWAPRSPSGARRRSQAHQHRVAS